jgi:hypothetical protein
MRQKERKIHEIISFSGDIMQIKTYRQLVKKVKEYCSSLMGFEQCAIFFLNSKSKFQSLIRNHFHLFS